MDRTVEYHQERYASRLATISGLSARIRTISIRSRSYLEFSRKQAQLSQFDENETIGDYRHYTNDIRCHAQFAELSVGHFYFSLSFFI